MSNTPPVAKVRALKQHLPDHTILPTHNWSAANKVAGASADPAISTTAWLEAN